MDQSTLHDPENLLGDGFRIHRVGVAEDDRRAFAHPPSGRSGVRPSEQAKRSVGGDHEAVFHGLRLPRDPVRPVRAVQAGEIDDEASSPATDRGIAREKGGREGDHAFLKVMTAEPIGLTALRVIRLPSAERVAFWVCFWDGFCGLVDVIEMTLPD